MIHGVTGIMLGSAGKGMWGSWSDLETDVTTALTVKPARGAIKQPAASAYFPSFGSLFLLDQQSKQQVRCSRWTQESSSGKKTGKERRDWDAQLPQRGGRKEVLDPALETFPSSEGHHASREGAQTSTLALYFTCGTSLVSPVGNHYSIGFQFP